MVKREPLDIAISIAFLIIILPFCLPAILSEYYHLNTVISLWKMIGLAVGILFAFISKSRISGKYILLLIGASFYILISTVINQGSIELWTSYVVNFMALPLLIELFKDKYYRKLLKIIFLVLFVEIIINFMTQLVRPEGLYFGGGYSLTKCYVLGMENRFVFTYIACLCVGLSLCEDSRLFNILYLIILIISNLSLIYAWSAGAMVALFVFDVLYVLSLFNIYILDFIKSMIFTVAINYALVWLRIQERIAWFIETYLQRDVSLTGRTPLWDYAVQYIGEKFYFGYGLLSTETLSMYFRNLTHPHNQGLHWLFQGGAFWLLINVALIIVSLRQNSFVSSSRLYKQYLAIYVMLAIMLVVDSWTSTSYLYLIFLVIYNTRLALSKEPA